MRIEVVGLGLMKLQVSSFYFTPSQIMKVGIVLWSNSEA